MQCACAVHRDDIQRRCRMGTKRINLLAATRTQDFNKNLCFDGKLMDDFVFSIRWNSIRCVCVQSDEMAEPEPSHTHTRTHEESQKFDGGRDGFTSIFLGSIGHETYGNVYYYRQLMLLPSILSLLSHHGSYCLVQMIMTYWASIS